MNKRTMFIHNRNGSRRVYDDADHSDREDRMDSIARIQDWRSNPAVYIGHIQQAGHAWTSGEVRRVHGIPIVSAF